MCSALLLLASIQPKVLWGSPLHGVRLGYRVVVEKTGPVEVTGYLENQTDRPIRVRADEPSLAVKPLELWLIGNKGSFALTPPIASPLLYDGPDPRTINLAAGERVIFNQSRFCFPVPEGAYTISARYDTKIVASEITTPLNLQAPNSDLVLGKANVSR